MALFAAITNAVYFFKQIIFDINVEESDEEDNDILDAFKVYLRTPPERNPSRINNYLEEVIPNYTTREFQMHFRITLNTFNYLLNAIGPLIQSPNISGRQTIDARRQLLAVIWLLATPDSYRSVGDRFNLGKSSLSACFVRVVQALNQIASQIIKWPNTEQRREISRKFESFSNLPGVVGAIDGSYVPIKAPKNNPEQYINRKCFYGITLQAIVESSMKFTNCFTGYPSSVGDLRIFRNSDIYDKFISNTDEYFSFGQYIIGDKAYQNLNYCIVPYIDRGNLNDQQTYFNTVHAQTRQVVERAFALLFGRFRRLKYLDMNRVDLIPATILACCVLHNVCLNYEDLLLNDYIRDGQDMVVEHDEEAYVDIQIVQAEGLARRDELARVVYTHN